MSVLVILVVLWILAGLKSGRPDGVQIKRVHPYRAMMAYIMPTRTESVVYMDDVIDAGRLQGFIQEDRSGLGLSLNECILRALSLAILNHPKMNRFVAAKRLYQRNDAFITFSAKRKRLDRNAKLAMIKMKVSLDENTAQFQSRVHGELQEERSDKKTYADKELGLFTAIPRPVLEPLVRLFFWLDDHNLLPGSFIENDGLFTSAVCTNLGSLEMAAPYHHLYEWGNCPLFLMIGGMEERPVSVNGRLEVKKILPIRWAYDERIDDGLNARDGMEFFREAMENPDDHFVDGDPLPHGA